MLPNNSQPTQPAFTPPAENQPMETGKPFSLTRHQVVLISVVGGFVLLFIFGLGLWAGEKRALRKYFAQPTPTNIQPSTAVPSPSATPIQPSPRITLLPTPTPLSTQETKPTQPPKSSEKSNESGSQQPGPVTEESSDGGSCWKCIEQGDETVCDLGRWENGVCVW